MLDVKDGVLDSFPVDEAEETVQKFSLTWSPGSLDSELSTFGVILVRFLSTVKGRALLASYWCRVAAMAAGGGSGSRRPQPSGLSHAAKMRGTWLWLGN